MNIDKVTITGADDSTDINWMLDITKKYPFVEWGILVSQSSEGRPRFPGSSFVNDLAIAATDNLIQLSVHVCGRWVREICKGDWENLIKHHGFLVHNSKRIQLNFHAYEHLLSKDFYKAALRATQIGGHQLIFQIDGTNDHLVHEAQLAGIDAVPLFDLSGGAGIVPDGWPVQEAGIYSGYAGGLGPDNVLSEIEIIEIAAHDGDKIWIDMETKVRTPNNLALDIGAVESVLNQVGEVHIE